jgi:hypothetical protein
MKKKVFVIVLSLLVVFCSSAIDAKAQSTTLPSGDGCLSRVEIIATGQGGDKSNIFIGIGLESSVYPYPPPLPEFTAAIWIKDNEDKYLEDIRIVGSEEEVWNVEVIVGGTADANQPGFYPVLSWDPNTICPWDPNTGYSLKLYSEDELGKRTLLIQDMSQISQYQTKEEDAEQCIPELSYCNFTYCVVWSKVIEGCFFTAEITATGQIITGLENNISRVIIGIDYYASKVESPPLPPDYTVVLKIADEYKEDIRKTGPDEEEEWELNVLVASPQFGGVADPNEPGFFPRLSWDTTAFCPPDPNTGKFRLYSDEQGKRTLLVPDMTQTDQYQTKEADGQCFGNIMCTFTYYIVWSKLMQVEMNFSAGWSMMSLPVAPLDAKLSTLFPGAAVMYRFERGAGYVRVQANEEVQVGAGYWILVYEDQNYVLTGQPIPYYTKTVYSSGWEMIGGCTSESGAWPTTDSCDIGVIYRFERGAGYVRVLETEAMESGAGFWILFKEVVDQCELTVESIDPGPLSRLRECSGSPRFKPGPQDEVWSLDIRAIGQGCSASSVKIGINPNRQAFPYPQSPPPGFTVVLKVKGDTEYYNEDIRVLGSAQEVWELEVMVGGTNYGGSADINQPYFFPMLTWDPSQIGPAKAMELRLGDANGPVLLDMRTGVVYPTKEADILNPSVNYIPALDYALFSYTVVFESLLTYYRDADNDGYGDPNDWIQAEAQPYGYVPDYGDCDDTDPNTYTGAPELCDGIDNDCDGIVPPAETTDADGDGFVDCAECDDSNPNMYPGNPEICDGKDNDCDGLLPVGELDFDGDGFRGCEGDCDDNANNIYPGATELCDGKDNDCNGIVDDPNVLNYNTYYRDADSDGYGNPNDSHSACSQPDGYVPDSTDCDDTDAAINPAAEEVYDGIDNNCDGKPDEQWYFVGNLIATGQDLVGQTQTVDVEFGLDWDLAGILVDPNNWADDIVRLQLIDEPAVIADPNNLVDTDYLISDIRDASGQTTIAWYVLVEIGGTADPNQPDYYPVLSWDTNTLGYTEVDGKDYVYQLISGLGDSGTVLVENMVDTNSYQTVSQDGDPVQYFTILWTQEPIPPAPPSPPPRPSQQILPWPGVFSGALGWGGIPFSAGFPGGLPYQLSSGYAPGLSIASFPGTYPGFTYPGSVYPSWTSYVPRFPATFPTLGLFPPVGIGWPSNYWIGFPQPSFYKTGWFYQYR